MNDKGTPAAVYELKGPGIELTCRRGEGTLDVRLEDESPGGGDGLEVNETAEADIGLHVTTALLPSSRTGLRIMFTALLPEVRWSSETEEDQQEITGVAIVVNSNEHIGGHSPPHAGVWHIYDDPLPLKGTASRAG